MMHELAEMAELAGPKGRCQKGYRRVKNTQGQFVCITKQPCPPTHKFNAKQFACVPKKQPRQPRAPQGGGQYPPVGAPGWDNTGGGVPVVDGDFGGGDFIPTDIYAPPVAGQPGYTYPQPGVPGYGQPCTNAYGQPSTIDPVSGVCMLTGQQYPTPTGNTGGPSALYPFGSPGGGYPTPGYPGFMQPQGPSALYPMGSPGGFMPQMPSFGGPVQFDQVPGGMDVGEGGGDDFIPSDAQMNLTPPGMPQSFGPQPAPMPQPMEEGGEVDASGGTDQEAYGGMFSNWFGMEGLAEASTGGALSPAAKTFSEFSDIALQTAERAKSIFGRRPRAGAEPTPAKQVVETASPFMPWLMVAAGIGLGVLAFRAIKK
jgi:hypothetical protein